MRFEGESTGKCALDGDKETGYFADVSRVAIKPELIRWARKRAGLSVAALTKQFPKFEDWQSGEAQPTFRQLEALAKKTATPFGYMFLPEPPQEQLPVPDFRTVRKGKIKRPSPDLLETAQTMQRRQEWMRDYLLEQGAEPLPFIGSASAKERPETVAAEIGAALRLSEDWARYENRWEDALRTLRERIRDRRILLFTNGIVGNNTNRTLDPKEFRGFVLCDDYAPLIFVNGADAKAAQMFTLVHELVHLWLGKAGVFSLDGMQPAKDATEEFCNQVAAEFLAPKAEMQACWREAAAAREPFQFLAGRFKVSPIVTARRALDLELISEKNFFAFYHAYEKDERRKKRQSSGGNFFAAQNVRIDPRFGSSVIRAAQEGRITYQDAYQLTDLHGQTFDRYTKALGFDAVE